MSLARRVEFEKEQISFLDYYANSCVDCKHWKSRIQENVNYCHRCIHNTSISISKQQQIDVSGLRDYFEKKTYPSKKLEHIFAKLLGDSSV